MKAFLAVAVVVLAATTTWLWHRLSEERERHTPELAAVALAQTKTESSASTQTGEPGEVSGTSVSPSRLAGSGAALPADAPFDPRSDPRLRNSPTYVAARERFYEAMLNDEYPDLARALKISEKTARQLIRLRANQQSRRFGAGVEPLNEMDKSLFENGAQQRQVEADAEITALIGAEKLEKWKVYESSIGERQLVRQFRLELLDSSEPLDFDRAEILIAALHEATEDRRREAAAMATQATSSYPDDPTSDELKAYLEKNSNEENANVLAAVKDVLTPSQLKMLAAMLDRQAELQNASTVMHTAQREARQ